MPENYQHLHFEVVGSTNDLCKIESKKKLKPTLITADKQTEGRGRNQKRWESPKGNISFSYGFFCGKPHPAGCGFPQKNPYENEMFPLGLSHLF